MKCCKRLGWLLPLIGGLILILAVSCSKDPVKPDKPEVDLATVSDTETEAALVLKNSDEENMVVLCDKDDDGEMTCMTGGAFVLPNGGTIAFSIGDNGLPELVFTDVWLFRLKNYTDSTVDIVGVDDLHIPLYWNGVKVDPAALTKLRQLGSKGHDKMSDWTLQEKLNYGGIALGVVTCAVGVATIETGVGAALAVAGCSSTALSVAALIDEDDLKGIGNTVVHSVTCVTMIDEGCRKHTLSAIDSGVKKVKKQGEKLKKWLPF